ncbi:MAG: glycosyltransferase family 4 protein [Gemmataceae bacterium]|nr:glycosyltransferase family 4 protein [Gemmataceae bacterium]
MLSAVDSIPTVQDEAVSAHRSRLRVLHVGAGNLYGGIETFLVTLACLRDLCPEMEPHFALFFEGRLDDELRSAGVAVQQLGKARVSRPWTVWLARRRLNRLLRSTKFDVVVAHGCWPHAIAGPVVRRWRLPLVFWGHALQSGRHWLERWARWTKPDRIIANSRATAATMHTLFPGVPPEVVYLPVSPPASMDRALVRREVRQSLGTPEDTVVIVQVSRMEPGKGHRLLLESLRQLPSSPSWECWIVGGPQRPGEEPYFQELTESASQWGLCRIRFLGQRADASRLLAAADIYCQPNTGPESFGIACVEALYARLPVVASAIGGVLEIVDETCGRLVPPGDPKILANTLRSWIGDQQLRRALGSAGPGKAFGLCAPDRALEAACVGLRGVVSAMPRDLVSQRRVD